MNENKLKGSDKAKATLQLKKNLVANEYLDTKRKSGEYRELIRTGLNTDRQGFKAQMGIIGLNRYYGVEVTRAFLYGFLKNHSQVTELSNELERQQFLKCRDKDSDDEIKRDETIKVLKTMLKPLKRAESTKITGFLKQYNFKTIDSIREEKINFLDKRRISMEIISVENPNKYKSKLPQKNINVPNFPNVQNWQGDQYFNTSYAFVTGKEYKQTVQFSEKLIVMDSDKRIAKFKRYVQKGNFTPQPNLIDNTARRYPVLKGDMGENKPQKSHKQILKNMGLFDKYMEIQRISEKTAVKEVKVKVAKVKPIVDRTQINHEGLNADELNLLSQIKAQY